jgi:murein DD-endopeptidase MepM/ murein hydrolase activator NlpD
MKAMASCCVFSLAAAAFYGTAHTSRAQDESPNGDIAPEAQIASSSSTATQGVFIIAEPAQAYGPQVATLTQEGANPEADSPPPIIELVDLPLGAQVPVFMPATVPYVTSDPKILAWIEEWERAAEETVSLGLMASPGVREASRTKVERTLVVRAGDTMMRLLRRANVPADQAVSAIRAMKKVYDPRKIVPGQKLTVAYAASEASLADPGFELQRVSLTTALDRAIRVERRGEDTFRGSQVKIPTVKRLSRRSGTVKTSLYLAAQAARLPRSVFLKFVRIYSWDVDFQRDLRPGDQFDVAWEQYYTPEGTFVRNGDMVYASLTLSGDEKKLYRFTAYYGTGYYDEKGEGARKPLMRTPINGARLSSGYGRRRHPFLGYTIMHRGVDFAGRPGTPVLAAGDGRIVFSGRNGAYGKFIKVRHNSRYETAYAHLRSIKKGIHPGARVRQGQVIGTLGSTGRSTGPHLHYEILVDGDQVNPRRVKMPSHQRLRGKDLAKFNAYRGSLNSQIASIGKDGPRIATVAASR